MAKTYVVQEGDNIGKISQKFGFSDPTSAGIANVPSGNFNLIRPGEQITIGNAKDDAVASIPVPPVSASSKQMAGQFYNASNKLDGIIQNQSTVTNTNVNNSGSQQNGGGGIVTPEKPQNPNPEGSANGGDPNPDNKTDPSADATSTEYSFENDPMYKLIEAENKKQNDEFNLKMEKHIQEYKDSFKTDLSSIDSTYASAEATANSNFERAAKLQADILAHNQSLSRLYGSSGGAGEANMMSTGAGMSANEMDYAHEIANLGLQRASLIAEAQKNRDAGKALALKNNISDITAIEEKMSNNMQKVAQEGLNKLKLLKDLSIQKQAQVIEKRKAIASSFAIQYADDYEKATTQEEKNKIVAKIIKESGGALTTSDVYTAINKQVVDKNKQELDSLKTKADIELLKSRSNNYDYKSGDFSNVTDLGKGIIAGYDIKSYATDPNHEVRVNTIYSKVPDITSAEEFDKLIKTATPTSPVTGQMIIETANRYGVDPKMIYAIMMQDSSNGTAGKAKSTFNPGNVGNDDAGNIKNYGSWEKGVDAIGDWLAKHRVSAPSKDKMPTKDVETTLADGTKISMKNLPLDYQTQYEKASTPEEKSTVISNISNWFKGLSSNKKAQVATSTQKTAGGFTYSVVE